MFPSKMDTASSLTAFNASSSPLYPENNAHRRYYIYTHCNWLSGMTHHPVLFTLKIMLTVVIIFIPIVIGYQAWVYNLFKGKINSEEMKY